MDHKWGRNLTTYGLGDVSVNALALNGRDATMCSPVDGSGGTLILTNAEFSATTVLQAVVPVDTQVPVAFSTRLKAAGHPHFPYGIAVAPDAPL